MQLEPAPAATATAPRPPPQLPKYPQSSQFVRVVSKVDSETLAGMRISYEKGELEEAQCPKDPLELVSGRIKQFRLRLRSDGGALCHSTATDALAGTARTWALL